MNSAIAIDVAEGLAKTPKSLPSKYFYDEKGNELFAKIMYTPEYYLTDCEMEIFKNQTESIISEMGINGEVFRLYELGAGDGQKTVHLLKKLQGKNFTYYPIDISAHALQVLQGRLSREVPEVRIWPLEGEYFEVLNQLNGSSPKIILFLGSNMGNMSDMQAHDFLKQLSSTMNSGDKILIGLDLKKERDIILPAYNDKQGYTREFNLNLLRRINRELKADFNIKKFDHVPEYKEREGIAYSYLQSKEDQEVYIEALDKAVEFKKDEKIFTEISRKYSLKIIESIIEGTGLMIKRMFFDEREYFSDMLFEKR